MWERGHPIIILTPPGRRPAPKRLPMALFEKKRSQAPLQVAEPEEGKLIPITREEIAMLHKPKGQLAEQFRALRNSIVALNPEGAPRTVMLTSALRGEGKTVATLNLAFALVEMPGAQVLVIDANMHHPGLEDFLGLVAMRLQGTFDQGDRFSQGAPLTPAQGFDIDSQNRVSRAGR